MAGNSSPSSGTAGRYSVTGLSSEVTIMAGIVTAVSQGFAQVSNILEIRPFFVAITISVLLASYYIRLVHSATIVKCLVLVPVVSAIIFAMSLSTNNLLAAAIKGGQTQNGLANEQNRITVLEAQLKNWQDQFNKLKQINELLRQLAGLPPEERDTKRSAASTLMNRLGIVPEEVFAAESSTPLKRPNLAEQNKILEQLRAFELEQKRLQDEAKRLKQQTKVQPKPVQEPPTLWRKW
jgi:hypothetical protein